MESRPEAARAVEQAGSWQHSRLHAACQPGTRGQNETWAASRRSGPPGVSEHLMGLQNSGGDALAPEPGQNLRSRREEVGCSDGVSVLDDAPAMAASHCCIPTAQQGTYRRVWPPLRMCPGTEKRRGGIVLRRTFSGGAAPELYLHSFVDARTPLPLRRLPYQMYVCADMR